MSDHEHENGWPADESPPTEREREQARELAGAVDRLLAGERVAAGEADDPLIGAALVRAGTGETHLAEERLQVLVQDALRQARGAARPRGRRWMPALALAASLLLVLGSFLVVLLAPQRRREGTAPRPLAPALLSRPSNDLLGRPIEDRAGASRRLDLVFADRLSGYRRLTLGGRR